jgi:DNA-binding CsgD family transcriptional regulator
MFVPVRVGEDSVGEALDLAAAAHVPPVASGGPARSGVLAAAAEALSHRGALVILRGGPGAGRSTMLRALGEAYRGPVHAGGGLATLRAVPGFALARAVRARLPVHDRALLVEAVRARVGAGLLLLDDLQWADPATLDVLPDIAAHCRVAAALRTPYALTLPDLTGAIWLDLPPLTDREATELARRAAPSLTSAAAADVVRRAGGLPLAVESLARHAAAQQPAQLGDRPAQVGDRPAQVGDRPGADRPEDLVHAAATALADLPRPARTSLAALGLLGRPAAPALLGTGLDPLLAAGLVRLVDGYAQPTSPYLAEVAAGLLDDPERRAVHRRLADLVPAGESARHLAAAGEPHLAYRRAVAAAEAAGTPAERADLLALACGLPGVDATDPVRLAAAEGALAAGAPQTCLRVLAGLGEPAALVLRAEAHLQLGDPAAALSTVDGIGAELPVPAGRDRVRLLAQLALDPAGALADAARLAGAPVPADPGLRAAVAAVHAATRIPGWEQDLAAAAQQAAHAGDQLAARWSGWLLVETLAADGRLSEAARAAAAGATACAADLAYSWQTRFLAARLWCLALRGDDLDDVLHEATELADRTLPALARGYATAAAGLAEADGGLLATARSRLAVAPRARDGAAAALDWVTREAAWLDGQPDPDTVPTDTGQPLVDGLGRITARWSAFDAGQPPTGPGPSTMDTAAVRATLAAWADEDPDNFDKAARAWQGLARREEVRCLLAHGLRETDPARAVPPLLAAESLAEAAGLVVLLGRTRRALRRHAVRRDVRGRRAGDDLTDREREVLRQVARGEPTRRIAGQLGISRETVETHIRSGMRKLGARTRTEAAVIALETLG